MSDTLITDAKVYADQDNLDAVGADFARDIERVARQMAEALLLHEDANGDALR